MLEDFIVAAGHFVQAGPGGSGGGWNVGGGGGGECACSWCEAG